MVLHQPVGVVARDHAVELPDLDAHPEDRARRWPPAARSCSSRPSRPRCAPSRCSRSSRRSGCPRASSTWSPRPTPRRSATSSQQPGRAQAHLHRFHRDRQADRGQAAAQMKRVSHGARRPRARSSSSTTPTPVHAAKGAAMVKFLNTGQACICPNRIFVQRGIAEAVRRHARAAVPGSCRPAAGSTTASPSAR